MPAHTSTAESVLQRTWMRRGPLACLLWPLSLLFGGLAAVRRRLYATGVLTAVRLPVPVIVAGNIFVGGTGKTPLVIWLAETLRRAGRVPGVVARGYGGADGAARLVRSDSAPREAGDEPVLIAARAGCPVAVGRDRVAAARLLLQHHPEVDVIVADDGLQHYRLARDIEILLFDQRGTGNGWLLPAGPLREPAARRADFTVVNVSGGRQEIAGMPMRLHAEHAYRLADPTQRIMLPELSRADAPRVAAAAGIGNPERFFAMLRAQGLAFDPIALPDHYDFARNPFADLAAGLILITEKDAVKCRHIESIANDARIWVVPVSAAIDTALAEKILEKLRGYTTA